MVKNTHHLILGGARSGKSRYAERQALKSGNSLIYIATAQAKDSEMAERIRRHKTDRDESWTLIEEPINIANALQSVSRGHTVLIDCLTLWLSNCLHQNCWPEQKKLLLNALSNCSASVLMVSNEVGSGVIPMGELSREFVDESGWLHQELAEQCNTVSLIVAGLATKLK